MTLRDLVLQYIDLSDQEILDRAPPITQKPIDLTEIASWLRSTGLMYELKALSVSNDVPINLKMRILSFIDHLADVRVRNLDSSDPNISLVIKYVLDECKTMNKLTQEQIDHIYSLGGGLVFKDLTLSQIAAMKGRISREARAQQLLSTAGSKYEATKSQIEQWLAEGGTEPGIL